MAESAMRASSCALCGPRASSTEMYSSRLDAAAFNEATFSARRLPDRVHGRIVRCSTCGMVRSDPAANRELLDQLYAESDFTYADELEPLRRTYGRYLRQLDRYGVLKNDLLEVGCGNGFFLEEALAQGYATVRGVEPSRIAVDRASGPMQPLLVCDVLRPGLFAEESFDVVCLFQVLDHISDPAAFLRECHRLLRPGGLLLAINHNVASLSARVLGERSPIFDVEHTYLYSPSTMTAIVQLALFEPLRVGGAVNTCSLDYLIWLLPVPAHAKRQIGTLLARLGIGKIKLSLPLGNLFVIARKNGNQRGRAAAGGRSGD